jgi:hypothetical protein
MPLTARTKETYRGLATRFQRDAAKWAARAMEPESLRLIGIRQNMAHLYSRKAMMYLTRLVRDGEKPMADEPTHPPPAEPVKTSAQIDQGLVAWAQLLRDSIVSHAGVEDVQTGGGSVSFRFRGQTFIVSVQRTS